jgi:hypothetical protein
MQSRTSRSSFGTNQCVLVTVDICWQKRGVVLKDTVESLFLLDTVGRDPVKMPSQPGDGLVEIPLRVTIAGGLVESDFSVCLSVCFSGHSLQASTRRAVFSNLEEFLVVQEVLYFLVQCAQNLNDGKIPVFYSLMVGATHAGDLPRR